jgi:hypothetical protein
VSVNRQIFSVASERQRLAYLGAAELRRHAFVSFVVELCSDSAEAVGAALDLVLRRKAIGAEALAVQRDAVLGGHHPELRPTLRELTDLRRRAAQMALARPGPEGAAAHRDELARWRWQRERLEAELAQQIPEMGLERQLRTTDRRAVAQALPEGSVLVEFLRCPRFDFGATAQRQADGRWWQPQWVGPARYMAFVLPAGDPGGAQWIDLGDAAGIDERVARFRAVVEAPPASLGGPDVRPEVDEWRQLRSAGERLRGAVFDPLLEALAGRTRLLLASDGDLSLLPFEVLPAADGYHLIDVYRISYLGCGRDALRLHTDRSCASTAPLVIADPDFDLAVAPPLANPVGKAALDRRRDLLNLSPVGRLRGTRREGQEVAGLLPGARLWLDGAALEGRLKAECRSPRILHLATHGFFLADPPADLTEVAANRAEQFLAVAGLANPLLRSGLVLAGFNTWLRQGATAPEAEDGVLTAEDVTGLDLLGPNWRSSVPARQGWARCIRARECSVCGEPSPRRARGPWS